MQTHMNIFPNKAGLAFSSGSEVGWTSLRPAALAQTSPALLPLVSTVLLLAVTLPSASALDSLARIGMTSLRPIPCRARTSNLAFASLRKVSSFSGH